MEIDLYLVIFLDDLGIAINHPEIMCGFITILLECKRNSLNKTFLPRNIQICPLSATAFQKKFDSVPYPKKIGADSKRMFWFYFFGCGCGF